VEDDEMLRLRHLPPEMRAAGGRSEDLREVGSAGSLFRTLREVQEDHVQRVLLACGGNKSRAARILGLSRQGLLDYLKRCEARRSNGALPRQVL
jgi:DNA-binding NtrC family response regulator